MTIKPVFISILAYTLITFVLAVIWHAVLFKSIYINLGYFEGKPNFLLGFISILIQGTILSVLFPHTSFSGNNIIRSLKYSLLIGIFFWTSHVLAFVAKQEVSNTILFVSMESLFLLLQFGFYGLSLGFIYSKGDTLKP